MVLKKLRLSTNSKGIHKNKRILSQVSKFPKYKYNNDNFDVDNNDIDIDDLEIKRLEKLLAIDTKRSNKTLIATKLNKEYEQYEGISGGFGDFLMGLDDLTNSIKSTKKLPLNVSKEVSSYENDDTDYLNQQASHESHDEEERSVNQQQFLISNINRSDSRDESDDGDDVNDLASEDQEEDTSYVKDAYQPVKGEDIYGRSTDPLTAKSDQSNAKYIPPLKRLLLNSVDMVCVKHTFFSIAVF